MRNIKEVATGLAFITILAGGCSAGVGGSGDTAPQTGASAPSDGRSPIVLAYELNSSEAIVTDAQRICFGIGGAAVGSAWAYCDTEANMNTDREAWGVNDDEDMRIVGSITVSACYYDEATPVLMVSGPDDDSKYFRDSEAKYLKLFKAAPVSDETATAEGVKCVWQFPMTKFFSEIHAPEDRVHIDNFIELQ